MLPLDVSTVKLYCTPRVNPFVMVTFSVTELPFVSAYGNDMPVAVAVVPSTRTSAIERSDAPLFLTEIRMYGTVLVPGAAHEDPVKIICSVAIWPVVSDAIHAATAMLTATVTAMSMIDATTGLRAFLLLKIFIFIFIPPFGGSCI